MTQFLIRVTPTGFKFRVEVLLYSETPNWESAEVGMASIMGLGQTIASLCERLSG